MNNFESYKEIYDLNISHINSNGGEDLSDEEKNILIAGYLGNMHETLSKISSNLCNLSKSDYEAAVYIANISECQRQINEELIKDDIQMFLYYKDITETEKIALIIEYINRYGFNYISEGNKQEDILTNQTTEVKRLFRCIKRK